MKMSIQKPHLMLCFTPNQSESASPAAVVEILITQNSAVTSGTLAATGCVLNTWSRERTLVGLLVGIAYWGGRGESGRARCRLCADGNPPVQHLPGAPRSSIIPGQTGFPADTLLPRDETARAGFHSWVESSRRRSTGSPPCAADR